MKKMTSYYSNRKGKCPRKSSKISTRKRRNYAQQTRKESGNTTQHNTQELIQELAFQQKVSQIPENFIIGFGSLINTESRIKTTDNFSRPSVPVIIEGLGLTPSWNFKKLQLSALGLIKNPNYNLRKVLGKNYYEIDNNYKYTNGKDQNFFVAVLFPVFEKIQEIDKREVGYLRCKVPLEKIKSFNWQSFNTLNSNFWIYVPEQVLYMDKISLPDKEHPMLQSYLDICILGCLEYGIVYTILFLQNIKELIEEWTSNGISIANKCCWVDDRIIPRRPWVNLPQHLIIDFLIGVMWDYFQEENPPFSLHDLISENPEIKNKCQKTMMEYLGNNSNNYEQKILNIPRKLYPNEIDFLLRQIMEKIDK